AERVSRYRYVESTQLRLYIVNFDAPIWVGIANTGFCAPHLGDGAALHHFLFERCQRLSLPHRLWLAMMWEIWKTLQDFLALQFAKVVLPSLPAKLGQRFRTFDQAVVVMDRRQLGEFSYLIG